MTNIQDADTGVTEAGQSGQAQSSVSTVHRLRSVLAIRPFRRLWLVTYLCSVGDWLSLLALTGFMLGGLSAVTLTMMGAIIFFFASAGASAAYLTASEVFPMETRALCIAFFYAIGTAAGGISGPLLFGALIESASASKDITQIAVGYFIGAALMIIGGIVEIFLGVRAEGRSLESIAQPLTAEDESSGPEADERESVGV